MRKTTVLHALLALVTLAAVFGGFTSFQRKRSSFERLDFQFHWSNKSIIVDNVDEGSAAERAGLRAGDQVWAVGATPSGEIEGLKRTLRRSGEVQLLVARQNQTLTIPYRAPNLKVDYQYLFLSSIGFLYLAIGLYTFFRGGGGESTLFYILTLLAFIVYVYSPAGQIDSTYKVLLLIEEVARIYLPPLSLHFFLRFPRTLLKRRFLVPLIYTFPTLLLLWVFDLYALGNAVSFASLRASLTTIDRLEMLQFAMYFTAAFVALTYTYRTAAAVGQKQIKWIYLGVAVGFLPFLLLYLVPFVLKGSASYPLTTIAIVPLALIPLGFALSILKYKLWDVEVVIKEVLAYSVTFIVGMAAFSTINLLLSRLVEEGLSIERNFLAFTSGLLIAGVLVPVKGRIESLIEMILYRDTYRHRKAIVDFAAELATFYDVADLIDRIRDRLSAAVRIQKINIYVRDGLSLLLYAEERGLPVRIREEDFGGRLLERPVVLDQPRLPDQSAVPHEILKAGYRYAFPLRHRNQLEGVLICSMKRGDEALSRDDLQLVGSLMAPVALAIENARLYNRLRRQLSEIGSLKEYNENIIESSSSAIVVVSAAGDILTGNRAFWQLMGTTPEDDSRLQHLFPPYEGLRGMHGTVQSSFVNGAGEEKLVSVTASPFSAPDAPIGTTVLVLTDVSERARLERELQEKDRLASLGLLAAGVAHEVNTPLAGISSYAQLLLKDTSPDDPRYALLKKMEQQTFRASRIVNNLLDLAANRNRPNDAVNLRELVDSTIALHEELLKAKEITVSADVCPDAVVQGNFYELQQVLTNLVLNARDAVSRGGHIWISVAREGEQLRLDVRDDGKGIDPALRSEIFKPLVSSKSGQGGTGLGLAICERIVQSLGGSISADSIPGAGATFSVRLPLHGVNRSTTNN